MSAIEPNTTLASLVTERPELAASLDALGLDYCCGGQRTLATALAEAGMDPRATLDVLMATPVGDRDDGWEGIDGLVDHIESVHHAYLRAALPRLVALGDKVASVHGDRHGELHAVAALIGEIRADLEPHMIKEEQVLFPMIRQLATATEAPTFHCGSLTNPISVMSEEHDDVGALLAELRQATDGYRVPDDGCVSYRALYAGLAELEADTHLHVHKENNLLFPQVLAAEVGADDRATMTGAGEGGDPPCWAHHFDAVDPCDSTSQPDCGPPVIDLRTVASGSGGVIWSLPHGGDLDVNLVQLDPGGRIDEHVNDEVDVMLYVRSGSGTVTIDGATRALGPGHLALIPLGALRSITAGPVPLNYLSVHRRRNPLQIGERRDAGNTTDA